ncbi:MAG: hypothetical protein IKD92_02010 [Lachnospiraceae bacterium]|nr:hypothetical protein [Lachnospiraceae bacterium]
MICEGVMHHVSGGTEAAIIYIVDAILVISVGIILVTRYHMNAQEVKSTCKKQRLETGGPPASTATYFEKDINIEKIV